MPDDKTASSRDNEYLNDYITGGPVKATVEERTAVQVMLKRLVEDYGYPKEHIRSHPQHRVRRSPSDKSGTFPVDIAVFDSPAKEESELRIVVECKSSGRNDGLEQLKLYMEMSAASIGIWFNGKQFLALRKIVSAQGERSFKEIPHIPYYGQRLEEIGRHLRRDLKTTNNLKTIFRDLRNYLAGNVVGITRDVSLASQILNVIFCKLYDELHTGPDEMLSFRASDEDSDDVIALRVHDLFDEVLRQYADVLSENEELSIDNRNLAHTVRELQDFSLMDSNRDAVGDAFEVFVGPALRGTEGQFFTPRNVVKMIVDMLNPEPGELIIDPACGSGGFLIEALEAVRNRLDEQGVKKGWSETVLEGQRREVATRCLRGVDKDTFLAKVTKAYMAIMGDGRGGVFCANSLDRPSRWSEQHRESIQLGRFDIVITNPPFGSKIKVSDEQVIKQYELGYKWKRDRKSQKYEHTNQSYDSRPPQLLFLERCVQFLRPGGRMGIVLPESMISNPSYQFVMQWLAEQMIIQAVVTLPEPLFKTSGKGGTHTKVCVVIATKRDTEDSLKLADQVFLSDVRWCGHDSRGNPTIRIVDGEPKVLDEVPQVAPLYRRHSEQESLTPERLAHQLERSNIRSDVYVPKYYDPRLRSAKESLHTTHNFCQIGLLEEKGILTISTGVEPGKMSYGTGLVPFIRTSDISNWELKTDPKHCVSEEIYDEYRSKCEVSRGDILMVRDGTYLVGTSAMITEYDGPLLFQSHIYRLRINDDKELDPYLLFAALNSEFVMQQIRSYQFTQDIIDTLGTRIREVNLAIPKDPERVEQIVDQIKQIIEGRAKLKALSTTLPHRIAAGFEESSANISSIR